MRFDNTSNTSQVMRNRVRRLLACLMSAALVGTFVCAAMADDTAPQARNYGTLRSTVKFGDTIGGPDRADWYRIRTLQAGTLRIRLDRLKADADLHVRASNGRRYWLETRGTGEEIFARDLPAGTHWVMVYGLQSNTPYRITFAPPGENFNSHMRGMKRHLGTLDGMGGRYRTRRVSGQIYPGDGYIDYIFTLPGVRRVSIDATIPGSVAALMENRGRNRNLGVTRNGKLTRELQGGSYFVRLFPDHRRGRLPFTLVVTATPKAPPVAPPVAPPAPPPPPPSRPRPNPGDTSNTPNFSRQILVTQQSFRHTESVGGAGDPIDWFGFTVVPRGINFQRVRVLRLVLSNLSADADLVLREVNGPRIPLRNVRGTQREVMTVTLSTNKRYWLGVEARGGQTNYELFAGW